MRVFSTFMFWSNENKSCMTVDEGSHARVQAGTRRAIMGLQTVYSSFSQERKPQSYNLNQNMKYAAYQVRKSHIMN